MEQYKATRPANRRPERNPDPCPLYRKCGGCQLQNLSYPQQLVWKQNQTERLLGKFGKVEPILGMKHPYHYRIKKSSLGCTSRAPTGSSRLTTA